MITIVDYGMGNIGSMLNMFRRIGVQACSTSLVTDISRAEKIVLPGVGSYDAALKEINSIQGLREVLDEKALVQRVPVLGVCLGMQLFTCSSEEGELPGFSWIPGITRHFPKLSGLKIPHMGWNTAVPVVPDVLTCDLGSETRFYFVHSYYVEVYNPAHSKMRTFHGIEFDSAIGRDNIFGVQFHPEKSHKFGMKILKNFAEL